MTDQRGFTLIETIISIVIVAIGIAGIFTLFNTVIAPRNVPQPFEITRGIELVQEGLETAMGNKRSLKPGYGFNNVAGSTESLAGGYTRTTSVAAWPVNTDTGQYRQVTVTVAHNGKTVASATTLVANY